MPTSDTKVAYAHTVTPGVETGELAQDYIWKSENPKNQLDTLVGLKEVGVRSAYTKMLFAYDNLIKGWLNTFEILSADEKEVIPVTNIVYGTPERVFAVNKFTGTGSMTSRITLPGISFRRSSMTRNFARGATLRNSDRQVTYTDDNFLNYAEIKSVHHIVDFTYEINFLTKYQTEMQMMLEQIMLPFGPQAYFQLKVPEMDFNEYIMVKLSPNISDGSTLDPQDGERVLKTTIELTMEGYIPIKVSRITKTINTIAANLNFILPANKFCTPDTTLITKLWKDNVFIFTQDSPLVTWSIYHNMGRILTPTINDSVNNLITDYIINSSTTTTIVITFPTATAGTAYLI